MRHHIISLAKFERIPKRKIQNQLNASLIELFVCARRFGNKKLSTVMALNRHE